MDWLRPEREAARRRRANLVDSGRGVVRIRPACVWGQAESRALARLAEIDPNEVLRPYLAAAGMEPAMGEWRGGGRPEADAGMQVGSYLSALALAADARPDGGLLATLGDTVSRLARCWQATERTGAPFGLVATGGQPDVATRGLWGAPIGDQWDVPTGNQAGAPTGNQWDVASGGKPGTTTGSQWCAQTPSRPDAGSHASDPTGARRSYLSAANLLLGLLDAARLGIAGALPLATDLGAWLAACPGAAAISDVDLALARLSWATGQECDERVKARLLTPGQDLLAELGHEESPCTQVRDEVNVALGALALFAAGHDEAFDIADGWWRAIVRNHLGPGGGVHLSGRPPMVGEQPSSCDDSCRSACATHRLSELSAGLFLLEPDAVYVDCLELSLANYLSATAPSLPRESVADGVPFGPGARIERDRPAGSCCGAHDLLTPLRMRHMIYLRRAGAVWVNMFVPSLIDLGQDGTVSIERLSSARYRIDVLGTPPPTLRLRWPDYATQVWLTIGEQTEAASTDPDGYITVPGDRWNGESIGVEFEWAVQVVRQPGRPERFSVRYGPWLMAALTREPTWLRWSPAEVTAALERGGPSGPWRVGSTPMAPLRVVGGGEYQSLFVDPAVCA